MKILGIETSCDETAAAIVNDKREILSNVVLSQIAEHTPYGGVVPEIASRAHIVHISSVIRQALKNADTDIKEIDGVAVTAGPGLIGGVIVGVMTAKALASASRKPFIAVNHLEGHALTARLTDNIQFPFLLLLVSGGHCQILIVEQTGKYRKLGGTIDDALGEAFDKTAKLLGLGYPGGPAIEKRAMDGDDKKFAFPRPMIGKEGCDFSFSGLKTAILRTVEEIGSNKEIENNVNDICASFQRTCGDIVEDRMRNAIAEFKKFHPSANKLVVAGGVAANKYLRKRLENLCNISGIELIAPPLKLCTDNAAMIAWAGIERLRLDITDKLDFAPRARWPLEELSATG